jgi:hypothetical protein
VCFFYIKKLDRYVLYIKGSHGRSQKKRVKKMRKHLLPWLFSVIDQSYKLCWRQNSFVFVFVVCSCVSMQHVNVTCIFACVIFGVYIVSVSLRLRGILCQVWSPFHTGLGVERHIYGHPTFPSPPSRPFHLNRFVY